jgi:hypothetical protein
MSKVTIAGDVNGTGVFTIASPNGNTNRTLTLPDVTATVITDSAGVLNIGAGQIYKDAIGNVGIGTSAPSAAAGTALAINGAGNQARLAFKNTSTGDTGSDGFQIGIDVAGEAFVEQRESLPLRFSTNAAERMRIDSSGNLLVGTTSRVGSGKLSILYTSTVDTGIAIRSTIESYNTAIQFLNTAATQVGTINTTTTTTSYSTSSDYRLKNTIVPMTGALDKVALLKPCTYKWNADGSDGQGFIAHELAEAEPGCVSGEKDAVDAEGKPQYQGIDTSFLVATLAAAIQEQQAMLVSLKAIVDAQGAEIASLKGASA